jgi:hypothetical protein
VPWFERWSPVPTITDDVDPADLLDLGSARARVLAGAPSVEVLVTDAEDHVVDTEPGATFLGTPVADLVGRTYRDALRAPTARFGPLVLVSDEALHANGAERLLLYDGQAGQVRVHAVTVVERTPTGAVERAVTVAAVVDEFPELSPLAR